MTTVSKKRTGFGPHPESEHPGQTRLECRSRTAISCDSHERREQHFRRPAEKSGQVLVRTQKANTPARCGWNRSEEHTSELQSQSNLVCRLLLEKKKYTRAKTPARSYSERLPSLE